MHHHIRRTVSAAALAAASATALAAPSQADPSDGDGWQTTVCDNGSTYSFAVRAPGNTDKAQFFQHFAFHDSATNAVLSLVSGDAVVTLTSADGTSISFPDTYTNAPRPGAAGRTTTCRSTYDATFPDGGSVHVESTDVVFISGR